MDPQNILANKHKHRHHCVPYKRHSVHTVHKLPVRTKQLREDFFVDGVGNLSGRKQANYTQNVLRISKRSNHIKKREIIGKQKQIILHMLQNNYENT